jgi:CheY-specific phosphatase CheX
MPIAEETLRRSVETIWSTVLGLPVAAGHPISTELSHDPLMSGAIQISGAWEGAVILDCTLPVARRAAALMFGVGLDETTEDQLQDALGELTTIISGTFKSQLPEPCQMSLPAIVQGDDLAFRPQGGDLLSLGFVCEDQPFQVIISQGAR